MSRTETVAAADAVSSTKRKQKSFYLTEDLLTRINGAVYWARAGFLTAQQSGESVDVAELPDSASHLVERAVWAEVLRLEKLFNKGAPFPAAPGKLSTGPGASGAERLRRSHNPGEATGGA